MRVWLTCYTLGVRNYYMCHSVGSDSCPFCEQLSRAVDVGREDSVEADDHFT